MGHLNSGGPVHQQGAMVKDAMVDGAAEAAIHIKYLSFDTAAQKQDEIKSSPLLTVPLLSASPPSQFGLFGGNISEKGPLTRSSRLFHNVTCPSSVFICGSQGSGKSNTLACLLENCLIPSSLGKLPQPLAGIVFHFDSFISDSGGLPCEAAFLASNSKASVRVLCAPTNVRTVQEIYRDIPRVKVEPLRLSDQDLNTKRMLHLMAAGDGNMPLYLHVVTRILRDMRLEQQNKGLPFSYHTFKQKLAQTDLTPMQQAPLNQRLETLESFMVNGKSKEKSIDWEPKAGQLTIVDLSCPCVTAEMACLLFNICLSLFLEKKSRIGRVVALDEAHKYMQESSESKTLTNSLLSTIRLQRHLGVRVLISTQEPTVSTKLLDLCSMTVVHRFTSPDWLHTLRGHLAGVSSVLSAMPEQQDLGGEVSPVVVGDKNAAGELFAKIVSLQTGQALVFAPSAIIGLGDQKNGAVAAIQRLAHRPLLVKVRSRLTQDGGKTVMN
ncbi:uncharacterized protein GLRG_11185 [Colletotrichum graminicola M1.001]|uniref:AAA+ ATPase domain-containing protein n=1 Tax=Colletotrichum graminicola (strain M1.001 / M2 / FGSC 10212) TaxID=645133 RepID=E3QYV3_COLGM|nr:uncharacterized protein GLRG_11185 [Colletotrichum graminicola M1.001]EFQ36041.1 hypothetical protein GLRG_11185 [Colletotrichum graminicola M1.001]